MDILSAPHTAKRVFGAFLSSAKQSAHCVSAPQRNSGEKQGTEK
jgi:hypothetical protein